ncbi:MAG TPA: hypothetical protein VK791_00605 [bacterium]|nr:hypothetical protein [bacterium]
MPKELQREYKGGKVDDNGMMSHNQPKYLGAEYQRGGMDTLAAGLALRNKEWIAEGFEVAYVTFMQQKPDGGFGDKVPTGTAFWLNACARTFLALKQSEYWAEYQPRVETYNSALSLASAYLVNNYGKLVKHDKNTPNRLLIDADALFFTAKLLGAEPPREAYKLRDMALALFDKESGAFQENGGGDSSYQAVNLQMLMYYATYYPSSDIDVVIHQGLEWELDKIGADGSVSTEGNSRTGVGKEVYFGKAKEVNTREVALMFAYAGQLYRDYNYTETALLIYNHKKK